MVRVHLLERPRQLEGLFFAAGGKGYFHVLFGMLRPLHIEKHVCVLRLWEQFVADVVEGSLDVVPGEAVRSSADPQEKNDAADNSGGSDSRPGCDDRGSGHGESLGCGEQRQQERGQSSRETAENGPLKERFGAVDRLREDCVEVVRHDVHRLLGLLYSEIALGIFKNRHLRSFLGQDRDSHILVEVIFCREIGFEVRRSGGVDLLGPDDRAVLGSNHPSVVLLSAEQRRLRTRLEFEQIQLL